MSECTRCSARAVTWLCRACESDLRKSLLHLSWLIDRLWEKALSQTREGESTRRSTDPTSPMPCHLGASADLDRVHAMLVRWVQDICETRGVVYPAPRIVPADFIGPLFRPVGEDKRKPQVRGHAASTTKSAAIWLANHTSSIACDEAAGMCCDEVKSAVELIVMVINRPEPDHRYLGPCPTRLTDNYGERICNTQLTARPDEKHVQCPQCKTTHTVEVLHDQQLRDTDAKSFTLSELFKMVLPVNREYVPLRTLQQWVNRGRLVPTGYNADGDPRFLLADVRALRLAKPQKSPTGAGEHRKRKAKAS